MTRPNDRLEAAYVAQVDLDSLYRRYASWLTARLRRRYDRATAEDLVQETYLRLTPFAAKAEIQHPQGLLLRIAENLATTDFRRRKRAERHAEDLAQASDLAPQSTDQFEAVLLRQVVDALPPIFRDVFVLSRFAGLSYAEIAQRLRLPLKTVEWRMSKALALCAAHLRE